MKHEDIKMDKKTVKKAVGMHDKQMHGGKKTDLTKLKSGGCTKMASGGMPANVKAAIARQTGGMGQSAPNAPSMASMSPQTGGMKNRGGPTAPSMASMASIRKPAGPGTIRRAKGGGIEKRGKTKGRMV